MNIEYILESIEDFGYQHYRNGEVDRTERLAFEVGLLRSKLREFSFIIDSQSDEIETLRLELLKAQK